MKPFSKNKGLYVSAIAFTLIAIYLFVDDNQILGNAQKLRAYRVGTFSRMESTGSSSRTTGNFKQRVSYVTLKFTTPNGKTLRKSFPESDLEGESRVYVLYNPEHPNRTRVATSSGQFRGEVRLAAAFLIFAVFLWLMIVIPAREQNTNEES